MNSNPRLNVTIIVTLFMLTLNTSGQISGSNMMEYQLGNIPDVKPADLSTLYDQLNLQYRYKDLKFEGRIEQFYSTDSIKRDYQQLSQFQLRYQHKKIELKVGNFYETLGRGLLLRSFEIPASIIEDRVNRFREGFYRDIQGVSFNYTGNIFRFKALLGKPLFNVVPPGSDERRQELVEAVQPEITFAKQNIGAIVMRHSRLGKQNTYGGLLAQGSLPFNLSYYAEYDRNLSENANPFQLGDNDSYGAYVSLTHYYGHYGASLEWKKYHNMLIGTGISEPPTLIKEQTYHVLNRSTHVTDLDDESGYQLEVYYQFEDGKMLTFNNSLAENHLTKLFRFYEYFLELYWPFPKGSTAKVFADFSKDNLYLEDQRYAGGIYYTQLLKNSYSVSIESELQFINRQFVNNNPIKNVYLGLIFAKSTKLSAGIDYEFSTDPNITDRPGTTQVESTRNFFGITSSYRPNSRNTLTVFAGERRGGPACTSGVCYEVLDFKGLEIRWTIKF